MKIKILLLVNLIFSIAYGQSPGGSRLKAVIYDFDGLDTAATDLPDGDYANADLSYKVALNPLGNNDMLGDRVLQLDLNWKLGHGEFGKAIDRFIQLDDTTDYFNFYFYNPVTNKGDASVDVIITEDDNKDNVYDTINDDRWRGHVAITRAGNWQLISIPLNHFVHDNNGGDGIFNAGFIGAAGMIFVVELRINKTLADTTERYFLDMLSFSEGALPFGSSIFNLPEKSPADYCLLGALASTTPDSVPQSVEGLFTPAPGKKIHYVNWFMSYSIDGTTIASNIPGAEVQSLLNRGYTPLITWEPIYSYLPRLDPAQPRLTDILGGKFDNYFNAFADKIKSYNDTVIIRTMHEFDGDWYSWSLTENNHDPALYISAFRHVVDLFRARGATKVKWMWCVNAENEPYVAYNWIMGAYPGDNYVDLIGTDIYNHPDTGTPPWKSFRLTGIEAYYYLTKYLPNKPCYICEVGCRERNIGELQSSQSKAEWISMMNKELQSNFCQSKALIFFDAIKEHDWRINSSSYALGTVATDIWADSYYFDFPGAIQPLVENSFTIKAYPNPFSNEVIIAIENSLNQKSNIKIFNAMGQKVFELTNHTQSEQIKLGNDFSKGLYFVVVNNELFSQTLKLVKTN